MSHLRFYLLVAVIYTCTHMGHGDRITTPPSPKIIIVPKYSTIPISRPLTNSVPADKTQVNAETPKLSTEGLDGETMPSSSQAPELSSSSSSNPEPSSSPSPKLPSPAPAPTPAPTPAPAPAPTPAPGPLPAPDQGQWSYTDVKTNATCIVVQFAAQLNVTYPKGVVNGTSLAHQLFNVPANATVFNGSCDGVDQWLTIGWTAPATNVTNKMILVFHKNDTTKDYRLKTLKVSLSPELFFNITTNETVVLYHGGEWQTPLATSYRCTIPTRLNMNSDSPSTAAALTISRLQEEAFRNVPGKVFSAARECGGGDVPDAVPIAVGCALGGLVLVVLGGYLVARKRSAARGYLSM